MFNEPFKIKDIRPIKEGMTISRPSLLSTLISITWFSLAKDTSISAETYSYPIIYLGNYGSGEFILDDKKVKLSNNDFLFIEKDTLCGCLSKNGLVYTEIILKEEFVMNDIIKSKEIINLKDMISYEEGSIANLDIVHTNNMKYVLMAFDEGTGLTPHKAPGNALLTCLEGEAIIGYEGKEYKLKEGESFRFDKNGEHSVTPLTRFKMSLLLVIE